MAQRGITESEIDYVLANPETRYSSEAHDDRTVVLGTTGTGRRLKVVVLVSIPDYVITVADRDSEV